MKMQKFGLFLLILFGQPVFAQENPSAPLPPEPPNIAKLVAELERQQVRIQSLEGSLEAQNHQIRQLTDATERYQRDVEMRTKALEEKMVVFQDVLNRAMTQSSPKLAGELKAFQNGLDLVQKGESAKAILLFEQFLKQYPKSPNIPNAYFWIAECRYALKDYPKAIKDYQKYAEKYPKSKNTAQALFKQGNAFLFLEMKAEARIFWQKLIQEFPDTDEAQQAKGKLASLEQAALPPPQPAVTPQTPQNTNQPVPPKEPADGNEF